MRFYFLLATLIAIGTARVVSNDVQEVLGTESERYLIELAPGETRWIAEDDKWALRRVGRIIHAQKVMTNTM